MKLEELRNNIDVIDKQLVELYEKRVKVIKEVAYYKIETGKPVLDSTREASKVEQVINLLDDSNNKQGIERLFIAIMEESRQIQSEIIANHVSR